MNPGSSSIFKEGKILSLGVNVIYGDSVMVEFGSKLVIIIIQFVSILEYACYAY